MSDFPFIAVADNELGDEVHKGDSITCPVCGGTHGLHASKDENGDESELLLFYDCGGKDYLAAVGNKLLPGVGRALQ